MQLRKIFICGGNTKLNSRITKHETKIYGKQMVLVFALHILDSRLASDSISWVTSGWRVATQWRIKMFYMAHGMHNGHIFSDSLFRVSRT